MSEAPMEQTEYGLAPAGDGWFVVNVRDGAWMTNDYFGEAFVIESAAVEFPQVGYTLHVLRPGQPNGLYHREDDQEDFLVLAGECLLIIEEQERRLHAGDFVHCPPGTDHIFVGAGAGPCVIFMAGARQHRGSAVYPRSDVAVRHGASAVYPRSDVAVRHGASAETDATVSQKPYAPFPKWRPGPPDSLDHLPFA